MKMVSLRRVAMLALGMFLFACGSDSNDLNKDDVKDDVKDKVESPEELVDSDLDTDSGDDGESDDKDDATAIATMNAESTIPDVADVLAVTGPITGGRGFPGATTALDLEAAGYGEKEFFFEGPATKFAVDGELTMDGKWKLTAGEQAPFRSRLLVRRPLDGSEFSGVVIVEWFNVSGGTDADPGFMYNSEEILREGHAWVGVSAQAVGIMGGGFSLAVAGGAPLALKDVDPERYNDLSHPGDDYSYDIYSQAAGIIRGDGDVDILEGLKPELLIAYGESQSAGRMVSYVNGVHPLAKQFDSFFIHSRGSSGSAVATVEGDIFAMLSAFGGGSAHLIRDDLDEEVFQFQTEGDVAGGIGLGFAGARQPDTDKLVTWEVAGTAHADQYLLDYNRTNPNVPEGMEDLINCENANNGPHGPVIRAALHHTVAWARDGTRPPSSEPLELDGSALRTDEHGNSLGGVRTPPVDVPISTLKGSASGDGGDLLCFLFGSVEPFSPMKLMELYPTHEDYVDKVKASAMMAVEQGFLLGPEADAMVAEAEASEVP